MAAATPSIVRADRHCRALAARYDIRGYKRIYLAHIRKTGGTSINNMFLALSGTDPAALYSLLARSQGTRLIRNNLVFVGWNVRLLNRGDYYYGFSHTPLHELSLPERTFTLTCFRDPIERVLSHYNMLVDFRTNGIPHPCMRTEGQWLGKCFEDFLERVPRKHLQNQLFMFSRHFSIDEAVSRVRRLSYWFFGDNFDSGVSGLRFRTGLPLEPLHVRSARQHAQPPASTLSALREELDEEYAFLSVIRQLGASFAS